MFRVVGIGELLWDLLPTGAQIGGAPANFSYHARALGADPVKLFRDFVAGEAPSKTKRRAPK